MPRDDDRPGDAENVAEKRG